MDWLDLSKKTVIVTGAGSGIGRAVAQGFARVGADVVVADVDEKAGAKTVDALEAGRAKGETGVQTFVRVDVSEKPSVDAMVDEALAIHGRLDVLVNNAGINIPRLLVDPAGKEELTEEIFDRTVSINQKGAFLCAQASARAMIGAKTGGVIVNMASESGLEGSEGQSAYAGTKAALYSLTRSWAKELGKHNIRVVGVAPGILEATALRTQAYEEALAYTRGITVEKLRKGYETQSIPVGRVGRLDEVGDVVVYLASKRSSYVHGTVVNISGGKSRA